MSRGPVAVIGGGMAGLAAAERLTERGLEVLLFEQRDQLGGRAASFRDPETGWLVENGQHIWMPVCTELDALLQRAGAADRVERQALLRVPFLERGGEVAVLQEADLPGRLGMLRALLGFDALSVSERARVLYAVGLIALRGPGLVRRHGAEPFEPWLERLAQTPRIRQVFWEPFLGSILNEPLRSARTDLSLFAIRISLLGPRGMTRLRWTVPSQGTVWEAVARSLVDRGLHLMRGTRIEHLVCSEAAGGVPSIQAVVPSGSDPIPVSGAIAAVPPTALLSMLPDPISKLPDMDTGAGLEWSPILNVHLWYAQPVLTEPVVCLIGSPLHWIFTKPSQEPVGGRHPVPRTAQHLNLVTSWSYDFLGKGPDEILPLMIEETAAHVPAARAVPLLASRVVHERRATFRAAPGSEAHRPGVRTPVANLMRAGAWTATGWPSTIEGAIRSGRAAAELIP